MPDLSDTERDNLSTGSAAATAAAAAAAAHLHQHAAVASHHHPGQAHHLGVVGQHGSPTADVAAAAALQHQRALNYSQLAAAAAVANGAAGAAAGAAAANGPSPGGGGALTPNEALLASNDGTAAAALAGGLALGPLGLDAHAVVPASSTETLLRNIQSLLKVAADNARQQERQISYEKGELTDSENLLSYAK